MVPSGSVLSAIIAILVESYQDYGGGNGVLFYSDAFRANWRKTPQWWPSLHTRWRTWSGHCLTERNGDIAVIPDFTDFDEGRES